MAELIPLSDAQKKLGIGRTTLYELRKSGQLKTVPIGRRRFISSAELDSFIHSLDTVQEG